MTKEQQDIPRIPVDLLRRFIIWRAENPDEELLPIESIEVMEPITIKQNSKTADVNLDWISFSSTE